MDKPVIAYLASEYPALSHTFIFREVQALRERGFSIATASINPPKALERMTIAEQDEAASTLVIKKASMGLLLRSFTSLAFHRPGGFGRICRRTFSAPLRERAGWRMAFFYGVEAVVLAAWMRERGIGHVHVHFANPAATVAWVAAADPAVSYSLSVHGPNVFDDVRLSLLPEKLQGARFVRCISHFCRSQVLRWLPPGQWGKTSIVRCGVDMERFQFRPIPENAVPEILCVGRLVPEKGQHVLVSACAQLKAARKPFHLTFVGDGPDRASLERQVSELGLGGEITFAGAVGQDAVHPFYNRADIFALASFAEGLPVVLMEAMAKGIPCVSTRIAAIPELIEHERTGLAVAPGDETGLANALQRLLEEPGLRRQLGAAGRMAVAGQHDIAQCGNGMEALFIRFWGTKPEHVGC